MNHQLSNSIIGTALGDSLGLPSEGMSRERIARRWRGPLRQRLVGHYGMISDDTEHTIITAQALIASEKNPQIFERILARKLRWWFAALPAGIGLATARAIIKLWLGFPPGKNGVFSAGNGPVMRSPIIGAYFANDETLRKAFVLSSTRLTHTDPKAYAAAMMAAEAAACACRGEMDRATIISKIREYADTTEWSDALSILTSSLEDNSSVTEFVTRLGFPHAISGYCVPSVITALFIWLRHRGDFATMIEQAVACVGDTDTIAAIMGGIAGAETKQWNSDWTSNMRDEPYSMDYIRQLGDTLYLSQNQNHLALPSYRWWLRLPRNAIFFCIVITHGIRRIFPPY